MKFIVYSLVFTCIAALAGCGTTDSQLTTQHNQAYIDGFHDGRHSGIKEAGNRYDHFIKDHARFENEDDYRAGWLAGEAEGKRLQQQASTIGNATATGMMIHSVDKEVKRQNDPDRIANDALKGTDTSELNSLTK